MDIQAQYTTRDYIKAVSVIIIAILVVIVIFIGIPLFIFLKIGGFCAVVIIAIYIVATASLANKLMP